jgi:hypothetical protein
VIPCRRRARLLGLVLAVVVVLGGCKANANLDIDIAEDGSGSVALSVTLDRGAVNALESGGQRLGSAVLLADLERAGWTISPWKRDDKGSATIRLSKPFARIADLSSVLAEIDGSPGMVSEVLASRSRSRLRLRTSVSMLADLRGIAAGVLSDAELAGRLRAAGLDDREVERELSQEIGDSLTLRIHIALPHGTEKEWRLQSGEDQRISLEDVYLERGRLGWFVGAVGLVILAFALLIVASRAANRARWSRRYALAEAAAAEETAGHERP